MKIRIFLIIAITICLCFILYKASDTTSTQKSKNPAKKEVLDFGPTKSINQRVTTVEILSLLFIVLLMYLGYTLLYVILESILFHSK